jgi:hypothetical protein
MKKHTGLINLLVDWAGFALFIICCFAYGFGLLSSVVYCLLVLVAIFLELPPVINLIKNLIEVKSQKSKNKRDFEDEK